MIPPVVHQVWIGPKAPPWHWLTTWPAQCPTLDWRLWREADVDTLDLNRPVYDWYCERGQFHAASNLVRTAILREHGGVYIDADTEALADLADAPFMASSWWAVRGNRLPDIEPDRVACGVMGAAPGHVLIERFHARLMALPATEDALVPSFRKSGGSILTELLRDVGLADPVHLGAVRDSQLDAWVVPAGTFYPFASNGWPTKDPAPVVYGRHWWGSTHGLY